MVVLTVIVRLLGSLVLFIMMMIFKVGQQLVLFWWGSFLKEKLDRFVINIWNVEFGMLMLMLVVI